jgi:hypothetical protein
MIRAAQCAPSGSELQKSDSFIHIRATAVMVRKGVEMVFDTFGV